MVTFKKFQAIAMSFPEVREEPHFEKTSFRIKKKIFASYDEKNKRTCIKLSAKDQGVFPCSAQTIIYPVPNA
jgi:predicted DNA-binding protein (MmcQ/YjbR family)